MYYQREVRQNSLVALLPVLRDFFHGLSLISEEIDSLDKIINQSIEIPRQDNPNEYVSIETQTCHKLSKDYIDTAIGSSKGLFVTVAHKSTETESEFYQLIDSLRETIDLLMVELKEKQAITNKLLIIIRNFTVNENKNDESHEQQVIKVRNKRNGNDDIVGELLQIDLLRCSTQKIKKTNHIIQ